MNKLVIIISLLILFLNNCFAKDELKFFIGENKIDLEGYFIQGGYAKGKTSSKIKIKFENRDVYLGKKNKFILGFGRDYSEVANLKFNIDNKWINKTLKIKKNKYKIQKIDGLPKKFVSPPKEIYERIIRENKLIAKVRTLNSKIDYTFQDFLLPANGIITGVFGSQRILNGKPRRPHYGIDIAAKKGSKVISPTDAIVRLSEKDLYFTGGTIMLDHGHGITSVYSHLSKVLVKKNDKIQKGDVIGLIGSTGRSTGPHLDWRINWFDQRLDPMMFIKNK